ncbi:hypothetical protein [Methanoculleus sp. UBA416]|jgi:uncharacterized membrane protein|uniref:hypothetical protein n=1 Tax=Methanoculleus sp. UBA416 TaxID=1915510 RepID=UPI00319DFBBA
MFLSVVFTWFRYAAKAVATGFLFTTLLPLIFGLTLGIPTAQVLGLIASTVILQANAAFVGVGMGIHPAAILTIMTLVEVGAVLALYFVCDAFAFQSARVGNLLKRTEEKMKGVPLLARYGAVTLLILPVVPPFGLYSSVVIGWVLQWDRRLSFVFITIGWIGVATFLIFIALGFVSVFV